MRWFSTRSCRVCEFNSRYVLLTVVIFIEIEGNAVDKLGLTVYKAQGNLQWENEGPGHKISGKSSLFLSERKASKMVRHGSEKEGRGKHIIVRTNPVTKSLCERGERSDETRGLTLVRIR